MIATDLDVEYEQSIDDVYLVTWIVKKNKRCKY